MKFQRNVRRYSMPLNIQTCTEKLLLNDDPGFVELSLERLGDDLDWDLLLRALRTNRTVKHVCFSGTFIRELTDDQWRLLLEGVGYLETLEELQIWCATIPIDTFGQLFINAQNLKKVYLFQVRLAGTQEDFDTVWGPALQHHPNLTELRLGGIQTIPPRTIRLDGILAALAQTPQLSILSLQLSQSFTFIPNNNGGDGGAPFGADAISQLLQSTTISDLYLTRLGLHPHHFVAIAAAIRLNTTLRVMDLFGNNNLMDEHFILLAQALQCNTSLETFVLPRQRNDSIDLSDDCSLAISQALRANTSLITLSLPCSNLSDVGLRHLAEGLTDNTTLKKIEVGVSKNVGEQGQAALTQMLEKNYDLERLVISSAEKSFQDKVEYYMRLNAVGRGSLLGRRKPTPTNSNSDDETTNEKSDGHGYNNRVEWVEMLISVRDDLDCLFYFITMNPTVCQYANACETDVIVTEEIKQPVIRRRHSMLDVGSTMQRQQMEHESQRRASVF